MISKELLSAVLPHGENSIEAIEIADGELSVLYRMGGWKYHNIHELAHKCKEWAFDEEYLLNSYKYDGVWIAEVGFIATLDEQFDEVFKTDTEPKTIFKACQWILDKGE